MKFNTLLFIAFLNLLIQVAVAQGDASSKNIQAVRTTERIKIDGILNESIWQRRGFDEFYQQEPNQGKPATFRSEVWVAFDDDAIYYAARYYDPHPDSILARLVRRDFVWGDPSDGTVFYLDSYGDKRNGYFFYVNAAGTLADGLLENDSKQTDLSWDAVWEGVPRIDSLGWCVEIRVPFSQLRFRRSEQQVWGMNVERYTSRRAETVMIAFTPRNENGFASRFPSLTGLDGIPMPLHLEVLPYLTGKAEYVGHDASNPFNPGHRYKGSAGLDIRAGLGSSLTLNATVNPDFGQVEVDPAEVNLTDVETAFREKRPFFTEGTNIYRFGNGGTNRFSSYNWPGANLFYSRRIGRTPQGYLPPNDYADVPNGTTILGAAKLSGRVGKNWKIGTLHAVTAREMADIELEGERSQAEVEPSTYYGVMRLQRDFSAGRHGIGILSTFTNRFFNDSLLRNTINKDALVTGLDGWTFLDAGRTWVLTGWAAASRVGGNTNRMVALQRNGVHYYQRPDADYLGVDSSATSLEGMAGRVMLNKNRGRFSLNAAVGFLSPGFETNDLGYGAYSDLINMHILAGYRFIQPTKLYQDAGFTGTTYLSSDFGGNKVAQGFNLSGYMTFRNLSGFNINASYRPQTFNSRRTRGGPLTINPEAFNFSVNANSDNRKWWVVNAGYGHDASKNAYIHSMYMQVEFKISTTLTLQAGPTFELGDYKAQWVTSYADPTATETFGRRYVFANLDQRTFAADIRADWIVNPNLSFQVYAQPYLVSGKYSKFKTLQRARSFDFTEYGTFGSTVEALSASVESAPLAYILDADGAGSSPAKTIGNPDFNYISLRGNAVLRWEYRPGSTLYLVWTQSREMINPDGEFNFGTSMGDMFNAKADNIFMVKLSYWL